MAKRLILAIDGPAGAGKSTIARAVAERLGYVYIDTGAMYRAVALWAQRLGVALDDMHRLERLALEANIEFAAGASAVLLNGEDVTDAIRTPEISEAASKVSAVPAVRRALVDAQRRMAAESSVVMEGRDIGTVVFPTPTSKSFSTPRLKCAPHAASATSPPGARTSAKSPATSLLATTATGRAPKRHSCRRPTLPISIRASYPPTASSKPS